MNVNNIDTTRQQDEQLNDTKNKTTTMMDN